MNGIDTLRHLNRAGTSGYELTVCLQYDSRTSYCWVLVRYSIEPSLDYETIERYRDETWEEIAHSVAAHLREYPNDGFIFE